MKVYLKRGRESSVKRFHQWIFSGAIKQVDGNVCDGDIVEIYSAEREFLGRGHWQSGSIAVRILTFDDEQIDRQFFINRISDAHRLRAKAGLTNSLDTSAYRLVHGEGDSLSGLVVDLYGDTAVMQAHSPGMWRQREAIAEALQEVCKPVKCVYNKSSGTLQGTDFAVRDGVLAGDANFPLLVCENGNLFEINPEQGQKTGFFIDQRENRRLLQGYARGASVLNLFCYTGGFSVYALRGEARQIVSVDSSAKAIEAANRNMKLNFGASAPTGALADAFTFLKNTDEKYNLIILDPPAFAKHHSAVGNALQAYKRLNAKAMEKLSSGGVLFTFSCSQAVSEQQFVETVFSAAAISGSEIKILHHLHQPADHPINIYHPEGNYLKGLAVYKT
ncbi:MAG: class I SAM-dependent rRNA methyltransferase [Prevotellaceae bacterium]|jgi:23S rRNA (cytosine1962-C5)-methyltransferase|nr:class I SAM-dependent rRNA methyltransferase [Prevotellaceae bacterium]